MTARIYTGAEARALLDGTTPGPWSAEYNIGATLYLTQSSDPHEDIATYLDATDANARLMAAAPDLAASVEHHARYADKAEAELIEAHDRARDAEAERAAAEAALTAVWQAITDDDLPRLATGDGTVVDAEAVGRRVAALVSRCDTANADFVGAADGGKHLARQVDHLEAEVARLTVALTAQTARADGAEATELRLMKERDALRAAVREYLTARDAWEEWQDGGREGGPSADARVSFARASAALRALLPEVTP